jgi:hypothetical protein
LDTGALESSLINYRTNFDDLRVQFLTKTLSQSAIKNVIVYTVTHLICRDGCDVSRRPAGLKVKPTRHPIHIKDFAAEV